MRIDQHRLDDQFLHLEKIQGLTKMKDEAFGVLVMAFPRERNDTRDRIALSSFLGLETWSGRYLIVLKRLARLSLGAVGYLTFFLVPTRSSSSIVELSISLRRIPQTASTECSGKELFFSSSSRLSLSLPPWASIASSTICFFLVLYLGMYRPGFRCRRCLHSGLTINISQRLLSCDKSLFP